MTQAAFPFGPDARGRTATVATHGAEHVLDMIEQVLFTSPGERVGRPDFGAGLLAILFAPGGDVLVAAAEAQAHAALMTWLGELIEVSALRVSYEPGILRVDVDWLLRRTGTTGQATFRRAA